jgi:hypothetical protein
MLAKLFRFYYLWRQFISPKEQLFEKARHRVYAIQADDANGSTKDSNLITWVSFVVKKWANGNVFICKLIRRRRDVEDLDVLDCSAAANFLEWSVCMGGCTAETCYTHTHTYIYMYIYPFLRKCPFGMCTHCLMRKHLRPNIGALWCLLGCVKGWVQE